MGKETRIIQSGSILLVNLCIMGLIDGFLIPVLMLEVGYILSVFITTFIFIIIGIISVRLYDLHKTDFLLIESLKESQYNNDQFIEKNRVVKSITKWSKRSRLLLGLLLSIKNTGLTVLYHRDGFHKYNGFSGKKIKLFFLLNSFIISIFWNTVAYTGFSLWKLIKGIF